MIHNAFPDTAGTAAKHCAELIKPGVAPADHGAEFERFGVRLAPALRKAVATSFADPALQVRSLGTRILSSDDLPEVFGPLAACSRYDLGAIGTQALLAIEGRAMLEQLDRVLGGNGELDGDLPAKLPVSAMLFAQRLGQLVMQTVGGEAGEIEVSHSPGDVDLEDAPPFSSGKDLTLLEFQVGGGDRRAWTLQLVLETAALPDFLPRNAQAGTSSPARKSRLSVAALGELPLPARATLVDMDISLHRLTNLEVGAVLPIIVARSVPLQVGDVVVARGSVGEMDDQAALQISQTFSGKEAQ